MDKDWDDIQACLQGNEDAYRNIIGRHESTITLQMRRFASCPADRDDLVQEVFVEAYFSLPRYKPQAPFLHWLRRIATHVGYQYWRKRSRQPKHVELDERDDLRIDGESSDITPEKAEEIITNLLARLAPDDRLVLTLMYLEECSIAEIAERAGWNQAATKMRAYRARNKLRKIVEQEKLTEALAWMQ